MKRYSGLWEQVLRWDNLLRASRKAQRGKLERLSEDWLFTREEPHA